MKYAIFGDIHGNELKELEHSLRFENPDTLICTGDFDQVRSIRNYMKLEQDYLNQGKQVITVPGNHDHSILNNLPLFSGTIYKQGKDHNILHEELKEDQVSFNYLDKLINNLDIRKNNYRKVINLGNNSDYRTIVIHGGLEGNLDYGPRGVKNQREKDLWSRIIMYHDKKDKYINSIYQRSNFNNMGRKALNVMIRGHDHIQDYTYNGQKKGIVSYGKEDSNSFRLFPNRQHTITHGALFDGHFATIDTDLEKQPILEFHQL